MVPHGNRFRVVSPMLVAFPCCFATGCRALLLFVLFLWTPIFFCFGVVVTGALETSWIEHFYLFFFDCRSGRSIAIVLVRKTTGRISLERIEQAVLDWIRRVFVVVLLLLYCCCCCNVDVVLVLLLVVVVLVLVFVCVLWLPALLLLLLW